MPGPQDRNPKKTVPGLKHWHGESKLPKFHELNQVKPDASIAQQVLLPCLLENRLVLQIVPVNVHVRKDCLEQGLLADKLHADDYDCAHGFGNALALHADGRALAQVDDAGNGVDLGLLQRGKGLNGAPVMAECSAAGTGHVLVLN